MIKCWCSVRRGVPLALDVAPVVNVASTRHDQCCAKVANNDHDQHDERQQKKGGGASTLVREKGVALLVLTALPH